MKKPFLKLTFKLHLWCFHGAIPMKDKARNCSKAASQHILVYFASNTYNAMLPAKVRRFCLRSKKKKYIFRRKGFFCLFCKHDVC